MRILEPVPNGLAGWKVMSQCHGCDEVTDKFLLVANAAESVMCICAVCVHDMAVELLKRYPELTAEP